MPRDIPVGNTSFLIAFDRAYTIRDIYFPRVGGENHAVGHPFRFGVWADGEFAWMGDEWRIEMTYAEDSLVTNVRAVNDRLRLELSCRDAVDFHLNVYLKSVRVKDLSGRPRDVRLFFHHDFHINGSEMSDTAQYDPRTRALIHYKGKRYFLINCCTADKCGVEHFACGRKEMQGLDGTWKDAEDGALSGNPISHGSVDSTAGISLPLAAGGETEAHYWMCAGETYQEVEALNAAVQEKTPARLLKRTENYWKAWIGKELCPGYEDLPPKILRLLKQSLLIARIQTDRDGAIIAANDTDVFSFAKDTYSFMWPRDGALMAAAFVKAGYSEVSRCFFHFCLRVLEPEGYFLHKYCPDGSVGSSWLPWWKHGRFELPIQEDEAALVVWALRLHFRRFHDVEFIKPFFRDLIVRIAEFLVEFRNNGTGLPLASYDLWEESRGVHTFTVSTVIAGLRAAAEFAEDFGESDLASKYRAVADGMATAMRVHLFDPKLGRFAKTAFPEGEESYRLDTTVDASLSAVWYFGVFAPDDPAVVSTMEAVRNRLWVRTTVGGLARYENDGYQQVEHGKPDQVPGNPWFISTLWWAEYLIARATDSAGLNEGLDVLRWVADHALPSGVLAEQINPYDGTPLSVSPLTWSHGAFVTATLDYLEKKVALEHPDRPTRLPGA
ncbi:MAG TPA: glycoside hydrolase family 15 protein [Candidatus Eisenbacteria bacterium]|nr:glycoside hydrolase family 15 protein [Candidatus Eisenbacteria bacterium]